jgi:polyhydroxybutyrate depolymerase
MIQDGKKTKSKVIRRGIRRLAVTSEDTRRRYLVHIPKSYDGETPVPVLMVLHGGGGSAAFAYRVHGWPELSEKAGFLAVFPEATPEHPDRPISLWDNLRIWNDGSGRSEVSKRNVDDVGYLSAVLDDVQADFVVDASRIYVTGFSNGASMSFRVGVELADRFAAIAPVSGHLCLEDPRPSRALSMLYIAGLADPINPFDGGLVVTPWGSRRNKPPIMESIHAWLRLIQASEDPASVQQVDGVRRARYGPGGTGCQVQLCTIEGQGHEWPGAQRTLPHRISGPQTDKLHASEAVWDFFANSDGRGFEC